MEVSSWFVFFVLSLFFFFFFFLGKSLLKLFKQHKANMKSGKSPPGPPAIPVLSNLRWLGKSVSDLERAILQLHSKYGPVVSVQMGSNKAIFSSSHDLAHKVLIQHGATFADRLPAAISIGLMISNQKSITSSSYGQVWRLLRRNLTSGVFHPSKVKSYAGARKWVLDIMKNKLRAESHSGRSPVLVMDHFHDAMFHLLVLMCFGEKLDESVIKQIDRVQRDLILKFPRFSVLDYLPEYLTKIVLRNLWTELYELQGKQESVILPLIRARQEKINKLDESSFVVSYVDTLLGLSLPEEGGRKLNEKEMLGLCSEFLNAGTDSTTSALQWIMANIVKHQRVQAKLFEEIKAVTSNSECEVIREEDLQKMTYLKAVVLEGLRRHPPAHFLLPHVAAEDTVLDGYLIPKGATVNFMVAEMNCDEKVWDDPMEFKPERFLVSNGVFDLTGIKGIKMMPFGVGRRICPGFGLAILHLEYFVANLVNEFKWTARDGDDVDLTEETMFSSVMKHPLWAHVSART